MRCETQQRTTQVASVADTTFGRRGIRVPSVVSFIPLLAVFLLGPEQA